MRQLYLRMTPTRRSAATTVALIALLVPLGYLFVFSFAPSRVSVAGTARDPAAREKIRHDARTAAIQFLGVVGLAIGAAFTARTLVVNRQGQITDRYGKAIEQLASKTVDVRIGAIYALERLARESHDDHGPVMEVLLAFVRGRPSDGNVARDVQAALTVVGRRNTTHDRTTRFDLRGATLRTADLIGAVLEPGQAGRRFVFDGAHLEGAHLHAARLMHASFEGAHLEGARLTNCTGRAWLAHCQAQGAGIVSCDGPSISDANLEGAYLFDVACRNAYGPAAQLQGTSLMNVDLRGATLVGADLAGARLTTVDLRGASLRGASLRGARLVTVDLAGADLTDADLTAVGLSETTWPDGLDASLQGDGAEHPAAEALRAGKEVTDARGLRLYDSALDLEGVTLSGTDLRGADLVVGRLRDLREANLRGATIHADLSGADLTGADARGAVFRGVTLSGANVRGADLRGADLSGADFDVVGLDGADLAGARYDRQTVWPSGFDPVGVGAVEL